MLSRPVALHYAIERHGFDVCTSCRMGFIFDKWFSEIKLAMYFFLLKLRMVTFIDIGNFFSK